ncbi:hypothetical protein [Indioceanicola profundi]|nr:hypothetical protein [Indioceanicola profundi]
MVDLALGTRRRSRQRWVLLSEFLAITGLFTTLYAWFVVGAAITA